MQTQFAVTAVAVAILVSALGVGVATTLDGATDGAADGTVSVSAAGAVTGDPDAAVVGVAVTARAGNASAATAALATDAATLRESLEAPDLSVESVRTADFAVFQQRENGTTTYVARQSFDVTTTDTTAAGAVIDVAVANGATDVGPVRFALSDERRRDLRADAIDAAVADARAQAEAAAGSAGLTVGEVRSISVDGGVGPVAERVTGDGTDIDVTPVTVTASVTVSYNTTGQ